MPRKYIPVTIDEKIAMSLPIIGDSKWVIVPFANTYIAVSDGRIISLRKRKPFVMKPIKMGNYVGLQLMNNSGVMKKEYLHRLILRSFAGDCPADKECAHMDGDKDNNNILNLQWVTKKENNQHKILHGTNGSGEKNSMAKLTREIVDHMKFVRLKGIPYYKIALMFNISTMTAFRAITGRAWK